MYDKIYDKLMILGDAAKYDVSCSSSGYSGNKTKNWGILQFQEFVIHGLPTGSVYRF